MPIFQIKDYEDSELNKELSEELNDILELVEDELGYKIDVDNLEDVEDRTTYSVEEVAEKVMQIISYEISLNESHHSIIGAEAIDAFAFWYANDENKRMALEKLVEEKVEIEYPHRARNIQKIKYANIRVTAYSPSHLLKNPNNDSIELPLTTMPITRGKASAKQTIPYGIKRRVKKQNTNTPLKTHMRKK